ncbi:3-methyl-2-oxobutanoate hydroxymethyltransferase [Sediminibacterium sp. TEGAF015]|uniref:3-methyl-2-oxobutanoate hydroxymethyltransferase n=1 Tax=Sediminibacterium sp. TEGAF015 TaxID=575378 RepID=UPI0021FB8CE0|nr:3-methyl-2-oxobutanoate hydroxymethyltransferase [Sediminibacterium sp. TEGAF015]BDQ11656.1 3-methyl-2-oxobutanoate hydroxymethyltransferase [Sediminibacterium sp. TEGAF015]
MKQTVKTICQLKKEQKKITMLTSYDYTMAKIVDEVGIEIVLVGDSLSNVFQGNDTTVPVTIEEMIYHGKAVVKGIKNALVVIDMPFGSYQINEDRAVENAIRIIKETNAQAIKLEGGIEIENSIKRITDAGIPVMGHLGLTPQSIHQFGSFELQATTKTAQDKLLKDAIALEKAGCFALVLEKVPAKIGKKITTALTIPVIGIGAGNACDGQVLVINDLIGLDPTFKPKFVRQYLNAHSLISAAVKKYLLDVKEHNFPNEKESY